MNTYPSLSLQERRRNLTALNAFRELIEKLNQATPDLEPSFRRSWIRIIILDLAAQGSGRTDWSFETIHHALVTLKLLGRSPIATDDLASHLSLFTRYANLLPLLSPQSDEPSSSTNQSPPPFDPTIAEESLRILANTLFLHPLARGSPDLSPALSSLVDLALASTIQSVSNDDSRIHPSYSTTNVFLASRTLFLITAVPSALSIELIESTALVINLTYALKLETQLRIHGDSIKQIQNTEGIPTDVMIEYLKLIFNLMVQYPKSIKQFGRPAAPNLSNSPFLASNATFNPNIFGASSSDPKLNKSPSSLSPGAIHTKSPSPDLGGARRQSIKQRFVNQMNLKKMSRKSRAPQSKELELGSSLPCASNQTLGLSSQEQRSDISSLSSNSRVSLSFEDDAVFWTESENKVFAGLLPYLIQLFLFEPLTTPPNLCPPLSSYIHTFLNFPTCPSFYSTQYKHDFQAERAIPPLISKLLDVVDTVTKFYCPDNPDASSVKQRCEQNNIDLDVQLTQVMVLLVNLLSPTKNPQAFTGLTMDIRKAIQEKIIPTTIDRSTGLNKQSNLIGRLLRLMNSINFESLKVTCGGLLYALFNEDADHLVSQVGYGPVAGFLMSIGKPGVSSSSEHDPPTNVNPITGAFYPSEAEGSPDEPISEQEREKEADRLCDLFDRLNRNGVIKVEDPRRKAVETGRFTVIEESVNEEMQREEEKEEQLALKELESYKQRLKSKSPNPNQSSNP
ncbi:guanine nucleotide exchange factor synembryn-domain-containing protein [Melampsora americana]|nr:guanine nucleotide exchange factor synembryn-domain-containing protein [Melampsora americana]